MTNTKILISTILAAAISGPALATADTYEVVNGEAGIIFRDAPSTVTREQVRNEMNARFVSRDGWLYVGGEAGWTLQQAQFVFDGDRLAHASECPLLSAVEPSKFERGEKSLPVYSGA